MFFESFNGDLWSIRSNNMDYLYIHQFISISVYFRELKKITVNIIKIIILLIKL